MNRAQRSRSTAAIALLVTAIALPARAQTAPAEPSAFEKGMELYRARDCKAAIEPLETAVHEAPQAGALLALGFCYRKLNLFAKATEAYQRYLQAQPEDEKRAKLLVRQTAKEKKAWRRAHPNDPEPEMESSGPAPTATEDETGNEQGMLQSSTPRKRAAVATPTGPSRVVTQSLQQENSAPSDAIALQPVGGGPAPASPRVFTWIAGGAAVACAGTGIVLGLSSRSTANQLTSTEHPGAQVTTLDNSLHKKAVAANVLVGVGVGLAVLSVGFFAFHF